MGNKNNRPVCQDQPIQPASTQFPPAGFGSVTLFTPFACLGPKVTMNVTNNTSFDLYVFPTAEQQMGEQAEAYEFLANQTTGQQVCDQTSYILYLLLARTCTGAFRWQQVVPANSNTGTISASGSNLCVTVNSDFSATFTTC